MAIDFPDTPTEGEQYTVGERTWTWNGTYWELSTSTSTFTASDTEPVDADPGDIWFDSTIGKTFINYSGTWVEIGNAATVVDVIADADADTKVQVEVSADSDKIEFTTAGTKRLEIDASGHVIPAANEAYDLGSASNRFRDLYLSGSSINLGGVEISSDGTSLTMPPVSNIDGDLTVGTDALHVDHGNSRVGIGTQLPNNTLDVIGDVFIGDTSRVYSGTASYGGVVFPRGEILFSNTNAQNQLYGASNLTMNSSGSFQAINTGVSSYWGLNNGAFFVGVAGSVSAGVTPSFVTGLTVGDNGYTTVKLLQVEPQDGGNEGGEIILQGPPNGGGNVHVDNFLGSFRIHNGSSVRFTSDTAGNVSIGGVFSLPNTSTSGAIKLSLWNNGSAAYGFGISSQDLDYFSDFNHRFHYGSGPSSLGTEIFAGVRVAYSADLGSANGAVIFNNAAVAIDRGWANYPSLTVFNSPSPYTEFRIHGARTTYAAYPNVSGADFSVNLRVDGTLYTSDARHKTNIVDNPYGLEAIKLLQPRKFDWINSDGEIQAHKTDSLGFIAQEVMQIIPQAVTYYEDEDIPNENGWCRSYSLNESYIVSTLVNAVKELSAKNDALEERILLLEAN